MTFWTTILVPSCHRCVTLGGVEVGSPLHHITSSLTSRRSCATTNVRGWLTGLQNNTRWVRWGGWAGMMGNECEGMPTSLSLTTTCASKWSRCLLSAAGRQAGGRAGGTVDLLARAARHPSPLTHSPSPQSRYCSPPHRRFSGVECNNERDGMGARWGGVGWGVSSVAGNWLKSMPYTRSLQSRCYFHPHCRPQFAAVNSVLLYLSWWWDDVGADDVDRQTGSVPRFS